MKSLIHKKETKKYKVWYQFENKLNNEDRARFHFSRISILFLLIK